MKNRHSLKLKKRMTKILKVAVIGGVVFPFFMTTTAQAHDTLIQSVPAANQHLDTSPASVQLTFSGAPIASGTSVAVVDSDLKNWADGEARVAGNTVTQNLQSGLPDGYYQVRARVVSSDGHVINPSYNFSIGDVAGKAMVPAVAPNAENSASQSTRASSSATESSASSSSNSSPAIIEDTKDAAASFPWWIIWVLLPILLILLIAWWIWSRIKARRLREGSNNVRRTVQDNNCEPPQ